MDWRTIFETYLNEHLHTALHTADPHQLYEALCHTVQTLAEQRVRSAAGQKKLYYISAEFLIGKLLSNNLINLGIYDEVKSYLEGTPTSLGDLEELEPEPSLGNGGLGRLAACFLDSAATLGLPADGIGLRYHLGLFLQAFKDHKQDELPDPWISNICWAKKTDVVYPVSFPGLTVQARMYDVAVTGYHGRTNTLHLFDVETVDASIVKEGISFDKEDIARNLTLFLYPDDSDENGRLLRIYQQYMMVSCGARLILDECQARGCRLNDLHEYAVIQINDTHPSMVIPELIRLLTQRGLSMDEAIDTVQKTCAYTNHTILAEALEKWPIDYLKKVVPSLVPVIEVLDDRIRRKYDNEKVTIIDRNDVVHMAHMDIHYSFSTNGVAALHTEILKNNELHDFYSLYPEKFNNKTNGITFRRWLLHCNPRLTKWLDKRIGEGYKTDASLLAQLTSFKEDEAALDELLSIKQENKADFCRYYAKKTGVQIDADSIFDVQIKRLHEYKRQQLNALYLIDLYFRIREGQLPSRPLTAVFGAKAAPAYTIAKDIIHLLLCLSELVSRDPAISPWLKIVMLENYNVTAAEHLIPAADISEQISLASKEASGTGNMKLMLNGALTLGTEDGANVEIHERVGDENIYIFGASSDEVIRHYANADYIPGHLYGSDRRIRRAVDFIKDEALTAIGDQTCLERLHHELVTKDWFMTLLDFHAYVQTKDRMLADYADRRSWAKKMLVNIAQAGFFSSDRTIAQYNEDIWHLHTEKGADDK